MRQYPTANRGAPMWPGPDEQRSSELRASGRHSPLRGNRLLLVATPFLLVAGVLSGTLLLRAQTPNADAALCAPKVTLGSSSVSPANAPASSAATIKAQLSASCGRTAMFAFDVYNRTGKLVTQMAKRQTLYKGSHAYTATWQVSASQSAGAYEVRLGVFSPTWRTLYAWFDKVATVTVGGAATSPTPVPPTATPPTPAPTASATATSTPSGSFPQPPTGGATPVGSALPTEAQCAAAIPASSWEPRTDNSTANHTVPTAAQIAGLAHWGYNDSIGMSTQADVLRKQITGNYTGTTDQILQWAACKWGIDPNIARAEAVVESWWHMSQLGDLTSDTSTCPPDGVFANGGCYQSYGILQVKWEYSKTAWPMLRNDTAFSAEYMYGIMRACYEGWMPWLSETTPAAGYPSYHAGDIWGCIGYWYSGEWYSQGALSYIKQVKDTMANKTWLQAGF